MVFMVFLFLANIIFCRYNIDSNICLNTITISSISSNTTISNNNNNSINSISINSTNSNNRSSSSNSISGTSSSNKKIFYIVQNVK